MAKKGNFNKASKGCILKSTDIWYSDLLAEVKFDFVSEHLPDNPDELAGTMPEGIIVRPAFRHLFVIISFEGGVVLNNIVCCVDECVSEHP